MPGWWMGAPWTVKNIWMTSLPKATARCTPAMAVPARRQQKYGSGGPVQGKIYAFSDPNAPMEAFTDKDQFFHGVGVDGVYLPFHKANQFLGMEALPTFIANDVIKMPDVPRYIAEYRKHLAEIFG